MNLPIAPRHPVVDQLDELEIENLSPLDALNHLAALKRSVER
jgi:hypothetical protein